jgi:hypothetical protein
VDPFRKTFTKADEDVFLLNGGSYHDPYDKPSCERQLREYVYKKESFEQQSGQCVLQENNKTAQSPFIYNLVKSILVEKQQRPSLVDIASLLETYCGNQSLVNIPVSSVASTQQSPLPSPSIRISMYDSEQSFENLLLQIHEQNDWTPPALPPFNSDHWLIRVSFLTNQMSLDSDQVFLQAINEIPRQAPQVVLTDS